MNLADTHENRILVSHVKNLLEMASINIVLKNEMRQGPRVACLHLIPGLSFGCVARMITGQGSLC